MQKQHIYSELLAKKLSGNASAEELQILDTWRKEQSENEAFAQKAEKLWHISEKYSDRPFVTDKKAAWQAIESKLSAPTEAKFVKMQAWRKVLQIAAMLVFITGTFWMWNNSNESDLPKMMAFTTLAEENKEITLPDGTTIWLNENSSISYAANFQKRDVKLSGEAFFDVARMEESPFEIISNGATTRVLGTSFNIRAYPNEAQVELTVKTGKVAFSGLTDAGKTDTKILTVGEAAIYKKETKVISESAVNDANTLAWQTKRLTFNATPIFQVEKDLERFYGIEIELKNPAIGNCRLEGGNGSFTKGELADILMLLEISTDSKITQEENKYIIEGEGCE